MHDTCQQIRRRAKVIPDALLVMHREYFSRRISSDDGLDAGNDVEISFPDVLLHRESLRICIPGHISFGGLPYKIPFPLDAAGDASKSKPAPVSVGDTLPDGASAYYFDEDYKLPQESVHSLATGKKVVLFGAPRFFSD
ncbi:peroxiredoxin-2B-like [Cucumis melo var. makuwa]|uniref:Peroxiredoxin-2B-like n=1 Tax=Cucumis melo var. makuwa TaxID=1194695 RepID=A0A5A7TX44_CUCMM|nr:peroxiredoxin-2B-like [Cucumis melo var. makuwa]TYK28711.1 peroxiredoxin-2B-like [Cucumis melo var. makuwa]